jgi:hypothetical protein
MVADLDSYEVGRNAVAPPQLPGDAPVATVALKPLVPVLCVCVCVCVCVFLWYQVFLCMAGTISSSPLRTTATASCAMLLQSTHHCGRTTGSTTS